MSDDKKNATVSVSVILGVDCPHCEEYFDLNDQIDFEDWETAGDILRDFCDGTRNKVSHNVICPKCEKKFEVNHIEY